MNYLLNGLTPASPRDELAHSGSRGELEAAAEFGMERTGCLGTPNEESTVPDHLYEEAEAVRLKTPRYSARHGCSVNEQILYEEAENMRVKTPPVSPRDLLEDAAAVMMKAKTCSSALFKQQPGESLLRDGLLAADGTAYPDHLQRTNGSLLLAGLIPAPRARSRHAKSKSRSRQLEEPHKLLSFDCSTPTTGVTC